MSKGFELLHAGDEQITLVHGRLSATPDGVLSLPDGSHVGLEFKSIDPRSNLTKPKAAHVQQANVQMGLWHATGRYQIDTTYLIYINASDYEDVKVFEVSFDDEMFTRQTERADEIFEMHPSRLPAEGAYDGECRYCAYTQECGEAVLMTMPQEQNPTLTDEQLAQLEGLASDLKHQETQLEESKLFIGDLKEQLKVFLREANAKSYKSDWFEVSYTRVKGRETLDKKALEEAGIELSPYMKRSDDSDRLSIKFKEH
jgi:hypothetical protein